jgi:hypothetical protein
MEPKLEKIGSVTMDLTYYPGEDFYSDGDIEDEMLDIAMNNPVEKFPEIIEQRKSWPIFYHFSPFRANIIDWIPFKKTDKVLEIGAGCGAITGAIARKAGRVTSIDLSKKRSMVNAYRNKDYDNITIMVGNFKDIEPWLDTDFDYVLLIGVFEYAQAYIGGDTPYEDFMQICNHHRRPKGHMVIAIENKFGLKYWAGCREDHLGTYFSGLEGYREGGSARTFTRHGLEKILAKTGIHEYSFYYPYPDYKFMTTIYSDRYLPKKGELCNNLRNFDRERVLLFDEKQVFDQIIEEKEFPLFSNSYLLFIGEAPDVLYTKFSNDRMPKLAIQTLVRRNTYGQICVEKHPSTDMALEHIENMKKSYKKLSERYEGTKVVINRCSGIGNDVKNGLAFEFCKGQTLETMLDECITKGDDTGFKLLVDEYMQWLSYNEDKYKVTNIDFIFPNIIIDDDKWQIIDYEWTYDEHIDAKYVAFRSFYNYILGSSIRKSYEPLLMNEILGFTEEEIKAAVKKEKEFQLGITGSRASVCAMREIIGNNVYLLESLLANCHYYDNKFMAKLYMDYGNGFSEADSVEIHGCYIGEKELRLEYEIPQNVKRLRIDPCAYRCSVITRKIQVGEKLYAEDEIEFNGVKQKCGAIVFDTEDPNFTLQIKKTGKLSADMEVVEMSASLANQLAFNSNKKNRVARIKGIINHKLKGKN